jgi:transposase
MIEKNHPGFIVDQVIDKLDKSPIFEKYAGGGTSSYHPRMYLRVLKYAYINNIYYNKEQDCCYFPMG